MNRRKQRTMRGMVSAFIVVVVLVSAQLACGIELDQNIVGIQTEEPVIQPTINPEGIATQQAVATATILPRSETPLALPETGGNETAAGAPPEMLVDLYSQLNPGVVSILVSVSQGGMQGEGQGSGFILDEQGHIVTNDHVVANAQTVIVVFFNGLEAEAEVIGTDEDSDLAVLQVEDMPGEAHPLVLGDSEQVQVGQWVIAIGNPFGVGTSMSAGIVSAIGRVIPAGVTQFSIPSAIQTDAAINPGNSGGPLINLSGEVIGVNAQIRTGGVPANAGVGFAIPSNIVRMVVPVLIESGDYIWPWLGVEGAPVGLLAQQELGLESQFGAIVGNIVQGGPASEAGLLAGDVIIEVDGNQVQDFGDLLEEIGRRSPGETMALTIIRNGSQEQVDVVLQPRP